MARLITVDGTAGVGKGTLCQRLARDLGWLHLDSGLCYRFVAWQSWRHPDWNEADLSAWLQRVHFDIRVDGDDFAFFCDGEALPVADLRREEVAAAASKIAAWASVRAALNRHFQSLAAEHALVADGRDMGTVVFPAAPLKIYLSASPEIRAERRYKQLKIQGENASMAELVQEMLARDERDRNRSHAPLKPASDAVCIDTSQASIDEVYGQVRRLVEALPS